jgi:GNAT superfamily N-acetyltransferase
MSEHVLISALVEDDWALLRDLRIRALSDAPDSFGPTAESALAQPEDYWRGWASGRSGHIRAWGAVDDGAPVGLVSGGVRASGVGHFGALWLDPAYRRSGLGRRLTELVCEWMESEGCTRLELEVTEGNPAEQLYASMGFARTGARQPLREGSDLFEVTMARERP